MLHVRFITTSVDMRIFQASCGLCAGDRHMPDTPHNFLRQATPVVSPNLPGAIFPLPMHSRAGVRLSACAVPTPGHLGTIVNWSASSREGISKLAAFLLLFSEHRTQLKAQQTTKQYS